MSEFDNNIDNLLASKIIVDKIAYHTVENESTKLRFDGDNYLCVNPVLSIFCKIWKTWDCLYFLLITFLGVVHWMLAKINLRLVCESSYSDVIVWLISLRTIINRVLTFPCALGLTAESTYTIFFFLVNNSLFHR